MERKGKRIQDPLLLKTKQQQLQQKKPTKKTNNSRNWTPKAKVPSVLKRY